MMAAACGHAEVVKLLVKHEGACKITAIILLLCLLQKVAMQIAPSFC